MSGKMYSSRVEDKSHRCPLKMGPGDSFALDSGPVLPVKANVLCSRSHRECWVAAAHAHATTHL